MAGQSIVESTIRRRAQKAGYIVNKSRWRKHSLDNYGDYALLDARTRFPVLGVRWDATLEEIDQFLKGH